MSPRLDVRSGTLRVFVDPSRCDGQGVCALVQPDIFLLDRYGDAYLVRDAAAQFASDVAVREAVVEAAELCPRSAIRVEVVDVVTAAPSTERTAPEVVPSFA